MASLMTVRGDITLAVMVDALSSDDILDEAQVLRQFGAMGMQATLIPTFGFEPDAAYFAGLFPEECNGGAHFWYEPESSPFTFTKYYPRWVDRVPEVFEVALRRLTRWMVHRWPSDSLVRGQATTGRIPFRFLQHFSPAMKRMPFEADFVAYPTIFDILRERSLPWFYHASPLHSVNSQSVLRHVKMELTPPCVFAFFHIGDLDRTGHRLGPDSMERKETLRGVDKCLEAIYRVVSQKFEVAHWVIFGDHGMMQVRGHLDLWSPLERLDLQVGKDYLFFLDSTMARFWFFAERANKRVVELLDGLEGGKTLTANDKERYRIRYTHNKFGDLLFLADPGVLIYPNFFQSRRPVKGMHGYAPETPEQQTAVVIASPQVRTPIKLRRPVDMRRVFPTLLTLIGLPIPCSCETASLV